MAITDPKTQPADGFQQLWSFGIECMCSNIYKSSFRYENVIMNWINITCQLLFQFAEQYLLQEQSAMFRLHLKQLAQHA